MLSAPFPAVNSTQPLPFQRTFRRTIEPTRSRTILSLAKVRKGVVDKTYFVAHRLVAVNLTRLVY